MTQPKITPFKLHFLPGMDEEIGRTVKAHHKREFGWLPNKTRRSKRKKKRKKS